MKPFSGFTLSIAVGLLILELSGSSLPSENSFHSSDSHPVHNVSGESEGDSLTGGEDLPLLKGHT